MTPAIDTILRRIEAGELPDDLSLGRLLDAGGADGRLIAGAARAAADRSGERRVIVRGLLEIGNRCRNNCLYCGIRAANSEAKRYWLSSDEIVEACRSAYESGFRCFVLQGGEWPTADDDVTDAVERLHHEFPDITVTLSLGERPAERYRIWRRAGAERYLLRHETALESHYSRLHPGEMTLAGRLKALADLREAGFAIGAGMMAGSPWQTRSALIADLRLIGQLRPEMVGIGPFIPHSATPLASFPGGSIELTLRLISIARLILPGARLPATTAVATAGGNDARLAALDAGADVIMPNITPPHLRPCYQLYNRKASSGAEAAEGLSLLKDMLAAAGYEISMRNA